MRPSTENLNAASLTTRAESKNALPPTVWKTNASAPAGGHEKPLISSSVLRSLVRESPYIAMSVTALIGVGVMSFTGQSLSFYWLILTPLYGAMCIVAGWPRAQSPEQRFRLIWKQALHWFAFLIAMLLVASPEVRGVENNNAAGLNLMTILASGAFVAGVHAEAWQISLVGALLALSVPAIAWIEQSAFLLLLVVALAVFVLAMILWSLRREKSR